LAGQSTDWEEIARWVELARRGDDEAFRLLLESQRSAITSTLFACGVRCSETARDLAQDVALRAWTGLKQLQDPRTFRAWVRRIAANAARDHLRRQAVRREDDLEIAVNVEASDDPHQEAERISELRFMLAALEEEDEEVIDLVMARADGVTVEELALGMKISQGALKMRLLRVRKRLRQRLEDLRCGG
jgi:RNA polymerase sigma-70 factor (ECF subfamily)